MYPQGEGASQVMQGIHLLKIFLNREDSGLPWVVLLKAWKDASPEGSLAPGLEPRIQ